MKRDWNLIERILTEFESDVNLEDNYLDDATTQHILLLINDGYLVHEVIDHSKEDEIIFKHKSSWLLSMKGHDLLEYLRAFKSRERIFEDANIPKTIDTIKAYFKTSAEEITNIAEMCSELNEKGNYHLKDLYI